MLKFILRFLTPRKIFAIFLAVVGAGIFYRGDAKDTLAIGLLAAGVILGVE